VDDPPEHPSAPGFRFGRRDPFDGDLDFRLARLVKWSVMSVLHPQYVEDALLGELVEPSSAGPLNQPTQDEESHVGIAKLLTRL
jgi:hypothetical protein